MSRTVSAPHPLTSAHDVSAFHCAVPELSDWLTRRALQNEAACASSTFVVIGDGRAAGYYALATGAVAHAMATGRVRRNMPEPVPVMVIARLAVDRAYQGTGLGSALLRDALLRTLAVVGIRAVLLHAMSDEAKRYYIPPRFRRIAGGPDDDDGPPRRWSSRTHGRGVISRNRGERGVLADDVEPSGRPDRGRRSRLAGDGEFENWPKRGGWLGVWDEHHNWIVTAA